MKTSTSLLALLAATGIAIAQTATVAQNYTGTVVSIAPDTSTFVVRSPGVEPVTYTYTKETRFVDPAGNAVAYTTIRNDTPVQVEYVTDGAVRRVNRVVVQPAPTTVREVTTTTTTTVEDD